MSSIANRLQAGRETLHLIIVAALALYLVIGVIAWALMLLSGVSAPTSFVSVLSTIIGGLIGILAPIGPQQPSGGKAGSSPE